MLFEIYLISCYYRTFEYKSWLALKHPPLWKAIAVQAHHNAHKSSSYDFGQIYWNPGDLQSSRGRAFLLLPPTGDEIESVLLAQICCWKCPELAVFKWRASLHCCSAHEGTTKLCEAAPCSFYPGSGNFCIPTGLAQAVGRSHSELELIRDLGLRKKPQ